MSRIIRRRPFPYNYLRIILAVLIEHLAAATGLVASASSTAQALVSQD
ncbi:MAG: hypothetical protein M3O68_07700 [Thermoproteota archaeon]|nr:hypothetical protein [Thermoproteota archaeon]